MKIAYLRVALALIFLLLALSVPSSLSAGPESVSLDHLLLGAAVGESLDSGLSVSGVGPYLLDGAQKLQAAPAYVDASATGANDGTSWTDAYVDLQDALAASSAGEEIWVAGGTYKPTAGADRQISFELQTGVLLYGGFAGTETALGQRDWVANPTILSGDIGTSGDASDNSHHVVAVSDTAGTSALDGFTITGGNGDGRKGGGVFVSGSAATLRNLRIDGNKAFQGGGLYNLSSGAAISVSDVAFTDNSASGAGGAIHVWGPTSSLTIAGGEFVNNETSNKGGAIDFHSGGLSVTDCLFSGNSAALNGGGLHVWSGGTADLIGVILAGNTAQDGEGGGMFIDGASTTVVNSVFSGNRALDAPGGTQHGWGGGLCGNASDVTAINTTFSHNQADHKGGATHNYGATVGPTFSNSIFWKNDASDSLSEISILDSAGTPSVTYSVVAGGYSGTGNVDADPQWVDAFGPDGTTGTPDDDLRLQVTSPAIDAGDNTALPVGVTTDLDGSSRFLDVPTMPDTGNGTAPIVDMGAYETSPQTGPGLRVTGTVRLDDAGGPGIADVTIYRSYAGYQGVPVATTDANGDYDSGFAWIPGRETVTVWAAKSGYSFEPQQYNWVHEASHEERTLDFVARSLVPSTRPRQVGSVDMAPRRLDDVWVVGNHAYVANSLNVNTIVWKSDLAVVDVTDTASPSVLRNVEVWGGSSDAVHVVGDRAYHTANMQGISRLSIVNAVSSTNPQVAGDWSSVPTDFGFGDVHVSGSYAFLAGSRYGVGSGLIVVSVADPNAPQQVAWFETPGSASGAFVRSGYAYVADGGSGLQIIDVTNPVAPTAAGALDTPGDAKGVHVVGDMAYVADGGNGLRIIDVSDPQTPSDVGAVDTPGTATAVHAADGYACVADGASGLRVIDVSDPAAPTESAAFEGIGEAEAVFADSGYAYVPVLSSWSQVGDRVEYDSHLRVFDIGGAGTCPAAGDVNRLLVNQGQWTTEALSHTLHVRLGRDSTGPAPATVRVVTEAGSVSKSGLLSFSDSMAITVPLKPNAINHPVVYAEFEYVPGCVYSIRTEYDEQGRKLAITQQPQSGRVVRVEPGGLDRGTHADCGKTWDKANLQEGPCGLHSALIHAVPEDELWVAAGTYKPTAGADRTESFRLTTDVSMYGGFAGTETGRSARDWDANPSILSGDIDNNDPDPDGDGIIAVDDITGGNSEHVVTVSGTGAPAVLDGFSITAGDATASYGGGVMGGNTSVSLANVTISGNSADINGGGMLFNEGSSTLANVYFIGNRSGNFGGGLYHYANSMTMTNVVISGNSAVQRGGGMYNHDSSPTLTNVTLSGNSAANGGGMYNFSGSPTMTNAILWGNRGGSTPSIANGGDTSGPSVPVISYSAVEGSGGSGSWDTALGTDGGGNTDSDPQFVDADGSDGMPGTPDDDLRLQVTSPAIDAGDNTAVPGGVTTDLDGNPRFTDVPSVSDTGSGTAPIVDMGAYETLPTSGPGLRFTGTVRLNDASGPGLPDVEIYRSYAGYQGTVVATTDAGGNYDSGFAYIPGQENVKVWAAKDGYSFDPPDYNWVHVAGYEERSLDFIGRTASPPNTPSNPSPADGAADVDRQPAFGWTGGDPDGDRVSYTVSGAESPTAPTETWCSVIDVTSCAVPSQLKAGVTYSWAVYAEDEHGLGTQGPTWSFTTAVPPPTPGLSHFALASRGSKVATIYSQNLDKTQAADVEARFYHQDGRPVISASRQGVKPLAHAGFGLADLTQLENGDYGVVVSSNRRIASAEVYYWPYGPAAAVSQLEPSTEVVVPLVVRNWEDQYSVVAVQNADESKLATVDVELYEQRKAVPVWTNQFSIGPGTSVTLDLENSAAFAGLTENFLGSMRIVSRSQLEVTAQAFVHQTTSNKAIYAYEGMPADAAAQALYVPLFRSAWFGTTGINVANPNPSPVSVSVTFYGTNQSDNHCRRQVITQGPVSVPANSAVNFWQGKGGGSGLPEKCFGSAVIRSTGGDVLAIVNDSELDGTRILVSAAYVALPAADSSRQLALPFVPDDVSRDQWNTGMQIMNVSSSDPATVRVTFIDAFGNTVPHRPEFQAVVEPGSAAGMVTVPGNLGDVFHGQLGTALITSDLPVMAIANTFALPFGSRDSSTYNALAAD